MLIPSRFLLTILVCLVSSCLLISIGFADEPPGSEYADIVLMNGTVYTVEYGTD
jgi:hypothetical protein